MPRPAARRAGRTSASTSLSSASVAGSYARRADAASCGAAKFGQTPPVSQGRRASTSPSPCSTTPGIPAIPTASRLYAAERCAKALGWSPSKAYAPPSWRSSTSTCGDPASGPACSSSTSAACVVERREQGRVLVRRHRVQRVGVHEIDLRVGVHADAVEHAGVAARRIRENQRSPSSGRPVHTNRTDSVIRPASGSGTPGMSGIWKIAKDVVPANGSSADQSRHAAITRGHVSPSNKQRAAVERRQLDQVELDRGDDARRRPCRRAARRTGRGARSASPGGTRRRR